MQCQRKTKANKKNWFKRREITWKKRQRFKVNLYIIIQESTSESKTIFKK